jgi:hypothetical protein
VEFAEERLAEAEEAAAPVDGEVQRSIALSRADLSILDDFSSTSARPRTTTRQSSASPTREPPTWRYSNP